MSAALQCMALHGIIMNYKRGANRRLLCFLKDCLCIKGLLSDLISVVEILVFLIGLPAYAFLAEFTELDIVRQGR